jgi:hypothetical protein
MGRRAGLLNGMWIVDFENEGRNYKIGVQAEWSIQ